MTPNELTEISALIKTYLPSISIAVTADEMQEWSEVLDLKIDYYKRAIKSIFRNTEFEDNQKKIRELKMMPLSTLRKLGQELYDYENHINETNKLAMNKQVVIFAHPIFSCRNNVEYCSYMGIHKINEKKENLYELVRDEDGKIIYFTLPKTFKFKEGQKFYKEDILKVCTKIPWEKVMGIN